MSKRQNLAGIQLLLRTRDLSCASISDPHVLYEGRFAATQLDDLNDISDMGTGRVSVTCP